MNNESTAPSIENHLGKSTFTFGRTEYAGAVHGDDSVKDDVVPQRNDRFLMQVQTVDWRISSASIVDQNSRLVFIRHSDGGDRLVRGVDPLAALGLKSEFDPEKKTAKKWIEKHGIFSSNMYLDLHIDHVEVYHIKHFHAFVVADRGEERSIHVDTDAGDVAEMSAEMLDKFDSSFHFLWIEIKKFTRPTYKE